MNLIAGFALPVLAPHGYAWRQALEPHLLGPIVMLSNAVQLLSLFSSGQPELGIAAIARLLRRPRSTTYRLAGAMEKAGLLDRDPATGLYTLGLRLVDFGDLARQSRRLQRIALPLLRNLARETGETTTLLVVSGASAVNLEVVESLHPVVVRGLIGRPLPLHALAGGKVLLACPSRDDLGDLRVFPLRRFTPNTITEPTAIAAELDRVRVRGWAEATEEWMAGVAGVAAPVQGQGGRVLAAVTLGYPCLRSNPGERLRLRRAVVRTAAAISRGLGYPAGKPAVRKPRTTAANSK